MASVTTEFNTVFETVTAIAEQTGPGDRFGESLVDGNRILDDLNPRMPRVRYDIGQVAALADVYADAARTCSTGLDHAVTTARALAAQSGDIDAVLMAAPGGADAAGERQRWSGGRAGVLARGHPRPVADTTTWRSAGRCLIDCVWGRQVGDLTINP